MSPFLGASKQSDLTEGKAVLDLIIKLRTLNNPIIDNVTIVSANKEHIGKHNEQYLEQCTKTTTSNLISYSISVSTHLG